MADAVSVLTKVVQLTKLSEEALRAINELLSSSSGEHDLVVGNPEDGDILLHSEKKSVGYGRSYVSHVYRYSGDVMITLVVAKDNWNNDTGGDPEIISGGPGHKHVEVRVTSRLLRGFDHTVLVFGKKRKRKRCNLM